jgi:uncharacterized protein (TIGR03066 family)
MKLASKLAALKKGKQTKRTEARAGQGKSNRSAGWPWGWLVLGLLVVGGGTFAGFEFVIWNRLPRELVGKWEVQGGPMAGGTFHFARDGSLETRLKTGDTRITLKAQVVLDGKTLLMTTQDALTRHEQTRKSTIRQLTASALVLELEDGTVLQMARLK